MTIIDDERIESLYQKMYESYYDYDKEYFDDFENNREMIEYDVRHCEVVEEGSEMFEHVLEHYKKNGLKYFYNDEYRFSIETVDDETTPKTFLIRR